MASSKYFHDEMGGPRLLHRPRTTGITSCCQDAPSRFHAPSRPDVVMRPVAFAGSRRGDAISDERRVTRSPTGQSSTTASANPVLSVEEVISTTRARGVTSLWFVTVCDGFVMASRCDGSLRFVTVCDALRSRYLACLLAAEDRKSGGSRAASNASAALKAVSWSMPLSRQRRMKATTLTLRAQYGPREP